MLDALMPPPIPLPSNTNKYKHAAVPAITISTGIMSMQMHFLELLFLVLGLIKEGLFCAAMLQSAVLRVC
jgi:hypothetical protein